MKLSHLLKGLEIKEIYNEKDVEITGIHYNSKEIMPGNLFVAIEGFVTDGHKYIPSAVENGASAILCSKYTEGIELPQIVVENPRVAEAQICAEFFGNPSSKFQLIGITGTNGKTTCTYLIKHILEHCGKKVGLIGTNQNMIGTRIIDTGKTTPDAFDLQKLFADMAEEKMDCVIMEVSSHALELSRVHCCEFAAAGFTNLTQDHLDFHITMDNYAKAKEKLFAMTKNAIINVDDVYGSAMASRTGCNTLSYGINSDCNLKAENVILSESGVEFEVGDTKFSLPIPGDFSVYNALCAIGITASLGVDMKDISDALASADGVKGRAEVVKTDTDYTVMIDYAHTPDGIENILKTVRGFAKGRVVIVFGCGGDRDNTKRPIMGETAGRLADFCVVTSDNPRSEDPMKIISMIEPGVKSTGTPYVVIENRREAIEYALKNAQTDDVIVLAGKGHETYQILAEGKIHFDEREVIRDILAK